MSDPRNNPIWVVPLDASAITREAWISEPGEIIRYDADPPFLLAQQARPRCSYCGRTDGSNPCDGCGAAS